MKIRHIKFQICFFLTASIFLLCGFNLKLAKTPPQEADETHYFQTEDGWKISIERYYNKDIVNSPENNKTPVILCHGLGYNKYFWSLDEKTNFAKYLADSGYDVWLVSLRGAGSSTKPGINIIKNLTFARKQEFANASFSPLQFDWNIDHYIRFDIPAAINFVKEYTKKPKVTWIGHSLGGMIMYAYQGLYNPQDVQAVVTIGSPLIVPQPPNNILQAFVDNELLFKSCLIVNTRTGATSIGRYHRFFVTPDEILLFNKNNTDDDIIDKLLQYVVEDLPFGVVSQVLEIVKSSEFLSSDRSINYTELSKRISVPILLCCGMADNLAPPESVRYVYHNIVSQDKTFKMFCTANGQKNDYGHNDLVIGKHAKQEVYPVILDWLNKHTKIDEE